MKSERVRRQPDLALAEAVALAAAMPDLDIVGAEVVRLPKAQAGFLFGTGKIAELKERFEQAEVDLVLVDGFERSSTFFNPVRSFNTHDG